MDLTTGTVQWVWKGPQVDFGFIAAGTRTVLVSLMQALGGPAGGAATQGIEALNSKTGAPRWSVHFPNDGQALPAVLVDGMVVISRPYGSVEAVAEADGAPVWTEPAPRNCQGKPSFLGPTAAIVGASQPQRPGEASTVLVAYNCPSNAWSDVGSIVGVDAATGARQWSWEVPAGWGVRWRTPVLLDAGGAGSGREVAVVSLLPDHWVSLPAVAGPTGAAPGWPTALKDTDQYQEEDLVVLDAADGRPAWELDNLVGNVIPVGGGGSVCAFTEVGIDCRAASDGAPRWSRYWPAMRGLFSAVDFLGLDVYNAIPEEQQYGLATSGATFYLVMPTPAAPVNPQPVPGGIRALPVRFALKAFDLATGRGVRVLPLPAFNEGPEGVGASWSSPPGVVLVSGGIALVSAELHETSVLEAIKVGSTAPA
jgi:outer membrane protein assembly factor BamB